MASGLERWPHRDGGLIKPLTLGQRVKKKHACQLVHLPSKAYGANLIKCLGVGRGWGEVSRDIHITDVKNMAGL